MSEKETKAVNLKDGELSSTDIVDSLESFNQKLKDSKAESAKEVNALKDEVKKLSDQAKAAETSVETMRRSSAHVGVSAKEKLEKARFVAMATKQKDMNNVDELYEMYPHLYAATEAYLRGGRASIESLRGKVSDEAFNVASQGFDPASGLQIDSELSERQVDVLRNVGSLREIANIRTAASNSVRIRFRDGKTTAHWGDERVDLSVKGNAPRAYDMTYKVNNLASNTPISRDLVNSPGVNIVNEIAMDASLTRMEEEAEKHLTGDGVNEPTGLLNEQKVPRDRVTIAQLKSRKGIPAIGTVRTVVTGVAGGFGTNVSTNANFAVNVFRLAVASLHSKYRPGMRFLMNSMTHAELLNMVDGDNRYLFELDRRVGTEDSLLNIPVSINENMPNPGAGNIPLILGDFMAGYEISDIPGMFTLVDEFTSKSTNDIEYTVLTKTGGRPADTGGLIFFETSAN